MSIAPALLTLAIPSDDERALIERMAASLQIYSPANSEAEDRYEGSFAARQFGISIPPSMTNLRTVAGWAGTAVDVLEERLDWLGWTSEGEDFGLGDVFAQNMLDVDSGMAHLDALIFGTAFVTVGTGFEGEPSPLITPHSPKSMTAMWDARRRLARAALSVVVQDYVITEATLYLPTQTVYLSHSDTLGRLIVDERDQHNLGRLPVVQFANRRRSSRESGRSEITKAVRYYSDAAMRTLLGLEVNREFYNSPQRVALNVEESAFQNADGSRANQWSAIQGRVWAIPPNEDGMQAPDVKQFSPASPAPYLDQIRGYAQLLAAEAGLPASYLGFATDNPASADAIRAGEARLVKRAERRQTVFGRSWLEVARLAMLVRDGIVPDSFGLVSNRWRDAATPTRAAAADEALKLTSGDNPILPPDSSVTYDRIGLSPAEQRQVVSDKRRSSASQALATLSRAANGVQG